MDRALQEKLSAMPDSPEKAELCRQALDISRELDYPWDQAHSLGILSFCEIVLARFQEALEHAQGSLAWLQKLGEEDKACRMENQIACIHRHLGNYRLAAEAYLRVGERAGEIGDRLLQASAYNNLGIIHYYLGDSARALDYYARALDLYGAMEEPRFSAGAMVNIADIQREMGEYRSALDNSLKAAMIMMEYGDKKGAASAHHVAGKTFRDMGDPVQAMDQWEKCIRLARDLGDIETEASALSHIAELMIADGKAEEALEVLDMADGQAKGLGDRRLLLSIHQAYAQAWRQLGDEVKAREHSALARKIEQEMREQKGDGGYLGRS